MATWRVARSLDALLAQLNAAAPKRSKLSDGSIGDAAHASRASDHNPWIKAGGLGIVTARDFTNDPGGGLDCNWLAKALVASGDPRIKYIIWNRRIWTAKSGWVAYNGTNPHDKHLHLSVSEQPGWFDSTLPWRLSGQIGVPSIPTPTPIEEDDMFTDPDRALLREVRDRLRGGDPNVDMLQRIDSSTGDAWRRIRGAHPDMDSFQALAYTQANLAALVAQSDGASALAGVPTSDVKALAGALADELDRRARDGDPATGPAS